MERRLGLEQEDEGGVGYHGGVIHNDGTRRNKRGIGKVRHQ
jgi:hypothetical protein